MYFFSQPLLAILVVIYCLSIRALTQIDLGTAAPFGIVATSEISNTGATIVVGELGLYPDTLTSITGFPPGLSGTVHAADGVANQAHQDAQTAYNAAAALASTADLTGQDLGGQTLVAGTYHFSSSVGITGALTLDGQNDPNAQFVFQIGSTLTTATASSVVLINGAKACNVFWQVGSSATLGTTTTFIGNILASASIALNSGVTVGGGLYALTGAVTLIDDQIIPQQACASSLASIPTGETMTLTSTTSSSIVILPISSPSSLSLSFTTKNPIIAVSTSSPSTSSPSTSTSLPSTSLPSISSLSTTLPSTTLPSTTLPSTTLPSTTLPSTTLPSTTLPSTTLPSTTSPSTSSLSTFSLSTSSLSTSLPSTTSLSTSSLSTSSLSTSSLSTSSISTFSPSTIQSTPAASSPSAGNSGTGNSSTSGLRGSGTVPTTLPTLISSNRSSSISPSIAFASSNGTMTSVSSSITSSGSNDTAASSTLVEQSSARPYYEYVSSYRASASSHPTSAFTPITLNVTSTGKNSIKSGLVLSTTLAGSVASTTSSPRTTSSPEIADSLEHTYPDLSHSSLRLKVINYTSSGIKYTSVITIPCTTSTYYNSACSCTKTKIFPVSSMPTPQVEAANEAVTIINGIPCTTSTYYEASCSCTKTTIVPIGSTPAPQVEALAKVVTVINGVPCTTSTYYESACNCVKTVAVPIGIASVGGESVAVTAVSTLASTQNAQALFSCISACMPPYVSTITESFTASEPCSALPRYRM